MSFYPTALWNSIISFLTFGPFAPILGAVLSVLSLGGIFYLFREDRFRLLVMLSPLLMALALVTLHLYPYYHRTAYYRKGLYETLLVLYDCGQPGP